jgi:hypothetical protein
LPRDSAAPIIRAAHANVVRNLRGKQVPPCLAAKPAPIGYGKGGILGYTTE